MTASKCGFLLVVLALAQASNRASADATPSWPARIENLMSKKFMSLKQPSKESVLREFPKERPSQPWPYRTFEDVRAQGISEHDTYAIVASVSHKVLPGVSTDMLVWWFNNVNSQELVPYKGDGKLWTRYLQWHPRDHIIATTIAPGEGPRAPVGALWRICEFFAATEPGYTQSSYDPEAADQAIPFIDAVTTLQKLDKTGMILSLPLGKWDKLVSGDSVLRVEHKWEDTDKGVLLDSSITIGVVRREWRPMWLALFRNAVIRGLYAKGQDPRAMLSKWILHCIEEFGNLPHVLPGLYDSEIGADSPAVVLPTLSNNEAGDKVQADEF